MNGIYIEVLNLLSDGIERSPLELASIAGCLPQTMIGRLHWLQRQGWVSKRRQGQTSLFKLVESNHTLTDD